MKAIFNVSTNIIRDSHRDIGYISTPNAIQAVNQISNDFKKGVRAFNIIGSYGTGKSSFLWAFQQNIEHGAKYFDVNLLPHHSAEFINVVGEYASLIEVFADYFEVDNNRKATSHILSKIFDRYHDLGKEGLLFIVIDEFGKFLEYAAQNDPEKELYFIQELAEFMNNSEHNITLLTAIHQNFDAYALSLPDHQKQEWTKVKGRFREITFNEPVEQLLFLAAEHLNTRTSNKESKEVQTAAKIFERTKAFATGSNYSGIASKLYPLDLLAASVITVSLQKYGQNERSLFSFLESTDPTGISNYNKENNPFYNVACVYDYLIFNFYSFLNSRYNPDFAAWSAIKSALNETERAFDQSITNYAKIIKTIGLLNITAAPGSLLDKSFLSSYAQTCLGISNADELIENLEKRKIILYRNYNHRFILFEGTDLDIQLALFAAGNKVDKIDDIVTLLKKYYNLPPLIAKSHSYLTGTPRLFEYRMSDCPIHEIPENEIDGFINLIFNDKLSLQAVQEESADEQEAVLYGYYKNTTAIKDLLFEIEKTRKVIEENETDRIAVRELSNILVHQKNLLNHKILHSMHSSSDVVWIFRGHEQPINSKKDFSKLLSLICMQVYSETPQFNNELVNKHKISASIHTAKRNYLKALVAHWDKRDLGFEEQKFPPEKTIYLTLLKENNIDPLVNSQSTMSVSDKNNFQYLWQYSNEFLNSTKVVRRKIADLVTLISKRPLKLKQGLIDFWIPSFLFIKRNDFALFGEAGYIPSITSEVLELVVKYPDKYEIKAFDIEGVKLDVFNSYRHFLNQSVEDSPGNNSFIETIRPFLTFYRALPEYSKTTYRLTKEALAIRHAIANSKDPELTFFEAFPNALGYTIERIQKSPIELHSYISALQGAIREIRTCYEELINRFENFIIENYIGDIVPFTEYKQVLQERYKDLRRHLLLSNQKTFIQRLDSALDDKTAWLNSIAQAVIGTTLERITDEQEVALYDKFGAMIQDLDNLSKISLSDFSSDKEEVFSVEITSFVEGVQRQLIRLPKSKKKKIEAIENDIREHLSNDTVMNIAALANILKEIAK